MREASALGSVAMFPVFPHRREERSPGPGMFEFVTPGDHQGISFIAYLIAHAPPVPGSFEREKRKVVKADSNGWKYTTFEAEPLAEWNARWSVEYAHAVIKVMEERSAALAKAGLE